MLMYLLPPAELVVPLLLIFVPLLLLYVVFFKIKKPKKPLPEPEPIPAKPKKWSVVSSIECSNNHTGERIKKASINNHGIEVIYHEKIALLVIWQLTENINTK